MTKQLMSELKNVSSCLLSLSEMERDNANVSAAYKVSHKMLQEVIEKASGLIAYHVHCEFSTSQCTHKVSGFVYCPYPIVLGDQIEDIRVYFANAAGLDDSKDYDFQIKHISEMGYISMSELNE